MTVGYEYPFRPCQRYLLFNSDSVGTSELRALTTPLQVVRKRNTVLRWGNSSWWMGCKFQGDEVAFGQRWGLGEGANEYAIHGGAVPIRVKNVEGIVAVCVVSGLKQQDDHMVVIEALEELKRSFE